MSNFSNSIEHARNEIIQKVVKNTHKACLLVENEAKKNCPVDQGPLRASITSDVKLTHEAVSGMIGSNNSYAPYVHNGTGIYAKDGNGRKTPWKFKVKKGKYKGWHVTKGQKPQPFLEKAKLSLKDNITSILGGS